MEKQLELEMYDYLIELGYQAKGMKRKKEIVNEINIFLKLCLFKFDRYFSTIEIFANLLEYYNIETSIFVEYIEDECLRNYIKNEISKLR